MSKALIITTYVHRLDQIKIDYNIFDAVICADAGLVIAEKLGIKPDYLIGDYDSTAKPYTEDVIVLPMEKDITDSEAAIDLAKAKGFDDITVLGGLGGRFDHTMGNLGMLAKHTSPEFKIQIIDGQNLVFIMPPGHIEIPKNSYKYLGLISYGTHVTGLTVIGVKYPLDNFDLPNDTSLGVSNEIIRDTATIKHESGMLLVILSNDLPKQ